MQPSSVRAIVLKGHHLLIMRRDKQGKQFCSLVGGSVDPGETPEQALLREVVEESSLTVADPRLVIIQKGGGFGMQYIYICKYVSGEPALAPDSIEAKIREPQKNYYEPAWLPLEELASTNLLPAELKAVLLKLLPDNFPDEPLKLTIAA